MSHCSDSLNLVPDREQGNFLAVAVGFEPTEALTPHTISNRAPSAARTRHRAREYPSRLITVQREYLIPRVGLQKRRSMLGDTLLQERLRSPQVDAEFVGPGGYRTMSRKRRSQHSMRQKPSGLFAH